MAIWEALGKKRLGKGKKSDHIPCFPSAQPPHKPKDRDPVGQGMESASNVEFAPEFTPKVPALCSYLFFSYFSFGRDATVLVAQLRRFSGRIFEAARSGSCSKSPIITALEEKHL